MLHVIHTVPDTGRLFRLLYLVAHKTGLEVSTEIPTQKQFH